MKRREFTKAQKAQMLKRASDAKGLVWCEGCGLNLTGKVIEFDHVIAEALVVDKTKPLTIENGAVLGRDCCHRSPDGKTAHDVAAIAQAKRREAAHHGIKTPRLSGPRFRKAPPQRRASAPLIEKPRPPRRLTP